MVLSTPNGLNPRDLPESKTELREVLTPFRFQCINHVHRSFIVLSGHLMITVGGTGGFVRSKQVQQFRPQRFLDFRCKGLIARESCFVSGGIVAKLFYGCVRSTRKVLK